VEGRGGGLEMDWTKPRYDASPTRIDWCPEAGSDKTAYTAAVLELHGLANVAYFWALPFEEIFTANSTLHPDAIPVAAKTSQTFLGPSGPAIVSILFMISAAGGLNGVILATARRCSHARPNSSA
jgi:hypothetical protein